MTKERSESEHSELAIRLLAWFDSHFVQDDFYDVEVFTKMRNKITGITLELEGTGFGCCDTCSQYVVCYKFGIPTGQESDYNYRMTCESCVSRVLFWEMPSRSMRRVRLSDADLSGLLKSPEGTRQTCIHCRQFILEQGDHGYQRWHAIEAVISLSIGESNYETGIVHSGCCWVCESSDNQLGCNTRFSRTVRNPNGDLVGTSVFDVNEGTLCQTCFAENEDDFRECDSCNGFDYAHHIYYSESRDASLCRRCESENYVECDDCGSDYRESRAHRHRCNETDITGVHYYSFKPRAIFYGSAKYHFGIELEMEAPIGEDDVLPEGVRIIKNRLGERVYLKEDSSIEHGFEMVTHPHSLKEFQTNFDWHTLNTLAREGWRSWDTTTCGLHVHVSRTAFEPQRNRVNRHQLAFIKFIYDNERAVQALAGRVSDYAKFGDKGRLIRKLEEGIGEGHFSAVNTDPEDTLEIRVFRGSLNPTRVLAAIEFVHAAIEHTRHMKVEPKKKPMAWTKFISYVTNNEDLYPHLIEKLESSLSVRNPNRNEVE